MHTERLHGISVVCRQRSDASIFQLLAGLQELLPSTGYLGDAGLLEQSLIIHVAVCLHLIGNLIQFAVHIITAAQLHQNRVGIFFIIRLFDQILQTQNAFTIVAFVLRAIKHVHLLIGVQRGNQAFLYTFAAFELQVYSSASFLFEGFHRLRNHHALRLGSLPVGPVHQLNALELLFDRFASAC